MATTCTVSFAKQKLVEMSYHSHNCWKNRDESDREYFNFLLEASSKITTTDLPNKMEKAYTKSHG